MMAIVTTIGGLIGRKGMLFVLLLCAILAYQMTKPSFFSLFEMHHTAEALKRGERTLVADASAGIEKSNATARAATTFSRDQINSRLSTARRERAQLESACASDLGTLVRRGVNGVIENRKACLKATLLTREIETLVAVRASVDVRRRGESVPDALRRQASIMRRAATMNGDARSKIEALDRDYVPAMMQQAELQRQRDRATKALLAYTTAKQSARLLALTQQETSTAATKASGAIALALQTYRALLAERAKALSENAIERSRTWAKANNLPGVARSAEVALAAIIAMPFLIRLFCYFVLAPIAMRRATIRLRVPGATGAGSAIPLPGRSTTSVPVCLAVGEELLVRQDYLQTSSQSGKKDTKWLLDAWHPLTSAASGLTFLTRIRGDGEVTTVSAVRDALAEVTIVTLPEGTSCVLHPRALAAVAQPISRPLRVSTHWRLGSLNAWLTLQLRYVVFHGPARLVVKGGRGVRVERAETGRIFGQDQLVGFTADLAYSVTRTETFWPYLLGREQLLKDRVEAGEGILIVEEAPLSARTGDLRRGLEGMIDAGMKVFGM